MSRFFFCMTNQITNKQEQSVRLNEPEQNFGGLGIAPNLLDVLRYLRFKSPTPIQRKAIPVAIDGKDLIGIAQTGTGKTLAFGIPMIQRLLQERNGIGLIVLPTRELAMQINDVFMRLGSSMGIKTAVLIGGVAISYQKQMIYKNPHVYIGTPGRIIDHLRQRNLDFRKVKILVLDEADRMFDMGFAPQINSILQVLPKNRQTMLFSATMPDGIVKIASSHMRLPVRVEIEPQGTAAKNVEHELFFAKKDQKHFLLNKMLSEYKGSVLVFCRTKFGARKICRDIRNMGHTAAEIHSNRSLLQRKEALEGFKFGRYRVLVATDIASRGIDVKGIELVLNYDLPENAEDYIHRIGRTGRAGMAGRAVSFVAPNQNYKVKEIERLTRFALPITQLPDLPGGSYVPVVQTRSFSRKRRFGNDFRRF